MTHVENLVHLFPVRARLFADQAEQRWYGEEVIFDHMFALHEVHHLCLCASGAMHHSMYRGAHLAQNPFDHRSVCAGGGEHEFAGAEG